MNKDKHSVDEYMEIARSQIQNGSIDLAIESISKAIDIDPTDSDLYANRSLGYQHVEDYSNAISDNLKSLELIQNYPKKNQKHKQFIEPIKDATSKLLNTLGVEDIEQGEYESAVNKFTKTIELDQDNFDAHRHRSICKDFLGDKNSAIEDMKKAIEIDPNDGVAFYTLGVIYTGNGDNELAIDAYNKCLEIDPNIVNAYVNRGNRKHDISDLKGACEDWKKAADLGDEDAPDMLRKYC